MLKYGNDFKDSPPMALYDDLHAKTSPDAHPAPGPASAGAHSPVPDLTPQQAMSKFMNGLAQVKSNKGDREMPLWVGDAKSWVKRYGANDNKSRDSYYGSVQAGWHTFQQVAQRRPQLLDKIDRDGGIRKAFGAGEAMSFDQKQSAQNVKEVKAHTVQGAPAADEQTHTAADHVREAAVNQVKHTVEKKVGHALEEYAGAIIAPTLLG